MDHATRAIGTRVYLGGVLNIVLLVAPLFWLSSTYMQLAENILGERVAWPQIAFMSAYPDDVRNGYLLFVAAVMTVVFASSGLCGWIIGASPGKALVGIRYRRSDRDPAGSRMVLRAILIMLLLVPILLAGPILGFLFGPAADPFSLAALLAGTALLIICAFPLPRSATGLSWINRRSGVFPGRR